MSDKLPFSFVSNIPVLASVYKTLVYDRLIELGTDPTELPNVQRLYLAHDVFSTEDPLCPKCAAGMSKSYGFPTSKPWDTPPECAACNQKLWGTLSYAGSTAVIEWTSSHVKGGNDLSTDDWLDLWLSLQCSSLRPDDTLWDDVGFILVRTKQSVAKP